ncbi:MAG: NADH-quinone oxidoreductase subunit C [Lachnospiraceae bacterium]|nr:NADH-quinone oxidoreductase subunit C [Lachnospiraceae bacterium]
MQENKKIEITREEILPVARRMREAGQKLVMIHGYADKEGANVVTYDYDMGPCVESYEIRGETVLPSISEIYDQAAAWPERELNELLGITFENLDMSKRLFMPENLLDGQGHILVTPLSELREKNIPEE